MEALEAIHTRRSIRKYDDKPVPDDAIRALLAAAMSAPSACNLQPWQFVVVTERRLLEAIPSINPYAAMAKEAPLGILVCGDTSLEQYPGYWVIDCAAASQNLLLAAHALGLGAVWTGAYPRPERMDGYRRLLQLPANVMPHALIVVGYPAESPPPQDRYREDRVHHNGWST